MEPCTVPVDTGGGNQQRWSDLHRTRIGYFWSQRRRENSLHHGKQTGGLSRSIALRSLIHGQYKRTKEWMVKHSLVSPSFSISHRPGGLETYWPSCSCLLGSALQCTLHMHWRELLIALSRRGGWVSPSPLPHTCRAQVPCLTHARRKRKG